MTLVQTEILSVMLDLCKYVVIGRIVIDWAQPNKLITFNGWKNWPWREHMCVLISSAVLLTAVDTVFIRLQGSHTVHMVTYGITAV